jgi:hypothetical protein
LSGALAPEAVDLLGSLWPLRTGKKVETVIDMMSGVTSGKPFLDDRGNL